MDPEAGLSEHENESLSNWLTAKRVCFENLFESVTYKFQRPSKIDIFVKTATHPQLNYARLTWSPGTVPKRFISYAYRNIVLVAIVSAFGILSGMCGMYGKNDGRDVIPLTVTNWGRDDVDMLLGPEYPLGRVISVSEWSTFEFGEIAIPAPPPAPPGTTVKWVRPPSDWLDCEVAKRLVKRLPEITFVPFGESLNGDLSVQDVTWLNGWITTGVLQRSAAAKTISQTVDIVYTWVNGSSPDFRRAKNAIEAHSRLINIPDYVKDTLNRHRDWDELRYSLRSIETFLERDGTRELKSPKPIGKVTIVSNGISGVSGGCETPMWLNARHPEAPDIVCSDLLVPSFLRGSCASKTFSSCAVEARLDRLHGKNDKLAILNDDMFLSGQHSVTDIYSSLYGLPFIFDYKWPRYDIDYPPAFGSFEFRSGETPYLYFCAYLLQVRFGWEFRSYPKHTVHSLSRSILRELRSTFPSAFELSSAQRFRGESPSVHLWFLFNWYVIERHREALIWSYLFGKVQLDGATTVNIHDLRQGVEMINTTTQFTRISMLSQTTKSAYEKARIQPNIALQHIWSSADGPVWLSAEEETDIANRVDEAIRHSQNFNEARILFPCEFRSQCWEFPEADSDEVPTELIFEKWRKEWRSCGDCLINALLRKSGPMGLSAFLSENPEKRILALKSIYRYSYTVSRVDARYGMMETPRKTQNLTEQWLEERPSQVCFNDHFFSEEQTDVDEFAATAKHFFEAYFPQKSKWEL